MSPEDDQFSDYNRSSANSTLPNNFSPWFLSGQVIKIGIAIAAVICDVLIVYAIIKLRKAQEVKYFYLLNWSVVDTLRCLLSPHVSFMVNPSIFEKEWYETVICWILQTESAFTLVIYVLVFLVTIDWIIANIHESWYETYRNKLIFIKISFYTFAVLYLWYASMYCLSNWREIHQAAILITLEFLLLYIICLHIFRCVYGKVRNVLLKIDFTIILPSTLALCWLPELIVHSWLYRVSNTNLVECCYFFGQCLIFGNAIVNLYFMRKSEPEFREKFVELIKWQCTNPDDNRYSGIYNNDRNVFRK